MLDDLDTATNILFCNDSEIAVKSFCFHRFELNNNIYKYFKGFQELIYLKKSTEISRYGPNLYKGHSKAFTLMLLKIEFWNCTK